MTCGDWRCVSASGAQRQRPLAPVPPERLSGGAVLRRLVREPGRHDHAVVRLFQPQSRGDVEIPLGPDNFIEPKEFDGRQPTSFPPVVPDATDAAAGAAPRARARRVHRHRAGRVQGRRGLDAAPPRTDATSVPGRAKTGAYGLRWPMAMGSVPPLLRFKADGPAGRGPVGHRERADAGHGRHAAVADDLDRRTTASARRRP